MARASSTAPRQAGIPSRYLSIPMATTQTWGGRGPDLALGCPSATRGGEGGAGARAGLGVDLTYRATVAPTATRAKTARILVQRADRVEPLMGGSFRVERTTAPGSHPSAAATR